jgi:hypothetical protein
MVIGELRSCGIISLTSWKRVILILFYRNLIGYLNNRNSHPLYILNPEGILYTKMGQRPSIKTNVCPTL